MAKSRRLHPGQLVLLWLITGVVEFFLYTFLGTIDIPTVPVPGASVPTVQENWMSAQGVVCVLLVLLMIAGAIFIVAKTWRWFGASSDAQAGA